MIARCLTDDLQMQEMQNRVVFYYTLYQSMHEEMEELETQLIFKYSKKMISQITALN